MLEKKTQLFLYCGCTISSKYEPLRILKLSDQALALCKHIYLKIFAPINYILWDIKPARAPQ